MTGHWWRILAAGAVVAGAVGVLEPHRMVNAQGSVPPAPNVRLFEIGKGATTADFSLLGGQDVTVMADGSLMAVDWGAPPHLTRVTAVGQRSTLESPWQDTGCPIPAAIAGAPDGTLLVAVSCPTPLILRLDAGGAVVKSFGDGGPSPLVAPAGIAVSPGGVIFVADAGRQEVLRFNANGSLSGTFGSPGSGPGQFAFHSLEGGDEERQTGITVMPDGRIAVSDHGNQRIQIFSAQGEVRASWSTVIDNVWYGRAGPSGRPGDLAALSDGRLLVLDTSGDMDFVYSLRDGVIESAWGNACYGLDVAQMCTEENWDVTDATGIAASASNTVYVLQGRPKGAEIGVYSPDGSLRRSLALGWEAPGLLNGLIRLTTAPDDSLYVN